MSLRGQAAVIAGASRGLGAAIARRLARDGASLMLGARSADDLKRVADEIASTQELAGAQVQWRLTDVSRRENVDALVASTLDAYGRLDILICNAGVYGPFGLVEDQDWDEWVRAVEINLFGVVLCCRAALTLMKAQRRGKIVIVSGGGATQPLPRISAYAASKAAVVRFAETLAEELKGTGIDVNSVAPGALNTRLLDEVLEAGPEAVGADFYDRAVRQKAEGGVSLDLGADLVAFLASSDSDGITGRLLSAVWDDWRHLPELQDSLARSDVFTLRRIVPQDRGWDGPSG